MKEKVWLKIKNATGWYCGLVRRESGEIVLAEIFERPQRWHYVGVRDSTDKELKPIKLHNNEKDFVVQSLYEACRQHLLQHKPDKLKELDERVADWDRGRKR